MFKFREIWPTENRWNRALFTWPTQTVTKLSLMRASRPKSDKVLKVFQISSKLVHFRRNCSRTLNTAKSPRIVNPIIGPKPSFWPNRNYVKRNDWKTYNVMNSIDIICANDNKELQTFYKCIKLSYQYTTLESRKRTKICMYFLYFEVRVRCRRKNVYVRYLISWWVSCICKMKTSCDDADNAAPVDFSALSRIQYPDVDVDRLRAFRRNRVRNQSAPDRETSSPFHRHRMGRIHRHFLAASFLPPPDNASVAGSHWNLVNAFWPNLLGWSIVSRRMKTMILLGRPT